MSKNHVYMRNKMQNQKIETKDANLASMKKKHEINSKSANESLKPKAFKMGDLDYTDMPTKINVIGPLSKPSAKKAKKGENPLQGGEAKNFTVA